MWLGGDGVGLGVEEMGLKLFQDGASGCFFLLKVVEGDSCGEESFHPHVTTLGVITPVILPKVWVAGYSKIRMHLMYVALHEVAWYMAV